MHFSPGGTGLSNSARRSSNFLVFHEMNVNTGGIFRHHTPRVSKKSLGGTTALYSYRANYSGAKIFHRYLGTLSRVLGYSHAALDFFSLFDTRTFGTYKSAGEGAYNGVTRHQTPVEELTWRNLDGFPCDPGDGTPTSGDFLE